jgi:hypothetical protein
MPRLTCSIGINPRTFNLSDDALVAVLHKWGDFGLLVEAQIRERLFRLSAERLVFLGRVNLGQTYLVLLLRCGQNREGVPVCYPNDFSTERCSLCG